MFRFLFRVQFDAELQLSLNEIDLFQLFHDGWFTHAADTLLRQRMANDAAPTYHYLFTHKGSSTGSVLFGGDANTWYGKSNFYPIMFMDKSFDLQFLSNR